MFYIIEPQDEILNWGLTADDLGHVAALVTFVLEIPFDELDIRHVIGDQPFLLAKRMGRFQEQMPSIQVGVEGYRTFWYWNLLDLFEFDLWARLNKQLSFEEADRLSRFCSDEMAQLLEHAGEAALTDRELEAEYVLALTEKLTHDEARYVAAIWGRLLVNCSHLLNSRNTTLEISLDATTSADEPLSAFWGPRAA